MEWIFKDDVIYLSPELPDGLLHYAFLHEYGEHIFRHASPLWERALTHASLANKCTHKEFLIPFQEEWYEYCLEELKEIQAFREGWCELFSYYECKKSNSLKDPSVKGHLNALKEEVPCTDPSYPYRVGFRKFYKLAKKFGMEKVLKTGLEVESFKELEERLCGKYLNLFF